MATAANCMCQNPKCNHPNGESCGLPVTNAVGQGAVVDLANEAVSGPWIDKGLCEDCWKRVDFSTWDRITEKFRKIFG